MNGGNSFSVDEDHFQGTTIVLHAASEENPSALLKMGTICRRTFDETLTAATCDVRSQQKRDAAGQLELGTFGGAGETWLGTCVGVECWSVGQFLGSLVLHLSGWKLSLVSSVGWYSCLCC